MSTQNSREASPSPKIAYRYRTPIPMIFWRNGVLDPKKKIYKNRLAFLTWAFFECHFDNFNFSCSKPEAAERSGLTEDEWQTQEEFFVSNGFLIKTPNSIKNRRSSYLWDTQRLKEDKITPLEKIPDQIPIQYQETQILKDEHEKKSPDQMKKSPTDSPTDSPTILREETEKNPRPIPGQNPRVYINDNKTINLSLSNSDNIASPRAWQPLSIFDKRPIIAFFDERKYRLRNNQPLSQWMINSIGKYSPDERESLRKNVSYYERHCDANKPIKPDMSGKPNHERFLQNCLNKKLAEKEENMDANDYIARKLKEDHQIHEMLILQTVIQINKNDSERPISIPKELPTNTFIDILDNYINNSSNMRLKHAT